MLSHIRLLIKSWMHRLYIWLRYAGHCIRGSKDKRAKTKTRRARGDVASCCGGEFSERPGEPVHIFFDPRVELFVVDDDHVPLPKTDIVYFYGSRTLLFPTAASLCPSAQSLLCLSLYPETSQYQRQCDFTLLSLGVPLDSSMEPCTQQGKISSIT